MLHVLHCSIQLRTGCLIKMTSFATHPVYKSTRITSTSYVLFCLIRINSKILCVQPKLSKHKL